MFDLDRGEDLELIIETSREFARERLEPALRAAESARRVDDDVRAAYEQIGLAGLELPESLGGAGLGALARVAVNEELGAADAGAAIALDPLGPALYPLAELGGEAALREHALPLLERSGARAVLVSEADAALETDGSSVSGTVPWVPAEQPDLVVLLDAAGCSIIREGIESTPLRGAGLRAAGAAELRLVKAPIAARLEGAAASARALARARLWTASLMLGVLHRAAEFSREYALERVTFGKPIAHHQALAFLITDMRSAVDGARLLLQEAAWLLDAQLEAVGPAAAAFVEAVEASRFVGPNGIQILGGHGFMQDYPVEKYMREARALGLVLGGIDAAREAAGQVLCASPLPVPLTQIEAS